MAKQKHYEWAYRILDYKNGHWVARDNGERIPESKIFPPNPIDSIVEAIRKNGTIRIRVKGSEIKQGELM